MSVRCAKCGEELLGAVNRCWKCGQAFQSRPETNGLPPQRVEWQSPAGNALDAIVLEDSSLEAEVPAMSPSVPQPAPPKPAAVAHPVSPYAMPRPMAPVAPMGAHLVESHRQSLIAMGGTVASMILGGFGVTLALFRFEGAVVALIGLLMGVWGLYSRKRNWALLAMLLCAAAITLGTYRGVRDLYIYIKENQQVEATEPVTDESQP